MKYFLLALLICFSSVQATESKATLKNVVYFVKDVKASLDFYVRVFDFKTMHEDDRGMYGELDCGGYTLAFGNTAMAERMLPGGFREVDPDDIPFGCELGFLTEDVQGLYDKAIAEGATSVAAPDLKPWGQMVAYVRDPQGILIEFCHILPR